jgi:glycosyltransferase involved in cell wall biosynthesis
VASDAFSVSAVIPAYNEAARIASAIACVRAQSEPAAEIVVVDDGSSDATADIAAAHGARVLRKSNGGLASARNLGLREARGSWVAFLDADDRWWPEKLAQLRAAYEAAPHAGLIASDYRVVYDGSRALGSALAGIPQFRPVARRRVAARVVTLERDSLLAALVAGNFLLTSSIAVRRADVERHALYYDESLPSLPEYHVSEDIEWFLRAALHCDVLLIESILADYNRHSDNMSASAGRLKYGDVKLGERVVAEPARYGRATAERFRAVRRAHLAESAILYMRELEFGRARAVGRQAFQESRSPADFGLFALATFGDSVVGRYGARAARSLWRGTSVRLRSVRPS